MNWKDDTWGVGNVRAEDGTPFKIKIATPSVPLPSKLTQEDVWGKVEESHWKGGILNGEWIPSRRVSKGMIVASQTKGYPDKCPIWHDKIPYKSVTVVCGVLQEPDVEYWLDFVLGTNSVSRRKVLPKGKLALRSDYKCW